MPSNQETKLVYSTPPDQRTHTRGYTATAIWHFINMCIIITIIIIYSRSTVRLHSQLASTVHSEVTEDKQCHCTEANFGVLCACVVSLTMLRCS